MNVLFLDDDDVRRRRFRSAVPCASIVEDATACIAELATATEPWDFVFLDHDLGGEVFCDSALENTGAAVARWIADNQPNISTVVVHSFNPIGAQNMLSVLSAAGYMAEYIPFGRRVCERVLDAAVAKG